jgi:hypothetical protein
VNRQEMTASRSGTCGTPRFACRASVGVTLGDSVGMANERLIFRHMVSSFIIRVLACRGIVSGNACGRGRF